MVRALAEHPLNVSLTIVFFYWSNHSARGKKENDVARHTQERETALPLELSMKVYMRTGNESLVNILAECGLSISYDHLCRLCTALINSVITLRGTNC